MNKDATENLPITRTNKNKHGLRENPQPKRFSDFLFTESATLEATRRKTKTITVKQQIEPYVTKSRSKTMDDKSSYPLSDDATGRYRGYSPWLSKLYNRPHNDAQTSTNKIDG